MAPVDPDPGFWPRRGRTSGPRTAVAAVKGCRSPTVAARRSLAALPHGAFGSYFEGPGPGIVDPGGRNGPFPPKSQRGKVGSKSHTFSRKTKSKGPLGLRVLVVGNPCAKGFDAGPPQVGVGSLSFWVFLRY